MPALVPIGVVIRVGLPILAVVVALGVVALGLVGASVAGSPPSTARQTGAVDGLWYWRLPDTPNGLRPNQSWSGPGLAANGDIYIGGMDHLTNAALYRLRHGRLRYVGDARAASEAAANWQPDEVAEKFHTHPTYYRGRVYMATHNSRGHDDGYLTKRGFKWYAYRVRRDRFRDLSAAEPGGSGMAHGGLITMAVDRAHGHLYGAIHPTGELVRYDIERGITERLGRPGYGRPYVYPGRMMWVDSGGRVYFSAGNEQWDGYGGPYDPAVFNHVHYYDPVTGFGEMTEWSLHDQGAIDAGQCFPTDRVCYLTDNAGHVYRFAEDGPSWSHIGSIGEQGFVWVFQVTPDQRTAYLLTRASVLFELDLASGAATLIADLSTVDPLFAGTKFLYGSASWNKGRFYFAAFDGPPTDSVFLTAIDPARLKVALEAR